MVDSSSSSSPSSALVHDLFVLSEPIREALSKAPYTPPEATTVNIKSTLQSLLPQNPNFNLSRTRITDFALCCAAISAASDSTTDHLSWIPDSVTVSAASAFEKFSNAYVSAGLAEECITVGETELDLRLLPNEKRVVIEVMPEVLPLLKSKIKESAVDVLDEGSKESAETANIPVAYAILAAHQFRWFVTQVHYPYLGKLCSLAIPCGLTALDHWSPEVKGQGMISFIHLGRNVNAAEIGWYEDVILDACCQNIVSDDQVWHYVVEMSVLLVTSTQRSNPRSKWYEKMLNEMLTHLARQPRNKERRVAWLKHIEPLLNGVGLILVAHFSRIFPLFFRWMHADDDDTVLLVLRRIKTIIKLTWIRNSPYTERLIEELVTLFKDAALRIHREEIRAVILEILMLLKQSKGVQFENSWDKYKDDSNLTALHSSLGKMQI